MQKISFPNPLQLSGSGIIHFSVGFILRDLANLAQKRKYPTSRFGEYLGTTRIFLHAVTCVGSAIKISIIISKMPILTLDPPYTLNHTSQTFLLQKKAGWIDKSKPLKFRANF